MEIHLKGTTLYFLHPFGSNTIMEYDTDLDFEIQKDIKRKFFSSAYSELKYYQEIKDFQTKINNSNGDNIY